MPSLQISLNPPIHIAAMAPSSCLNNMCWLALCSSKVMSTSPRHSRTGSMAVVALLTLFAVDGMVSGGTETRQRDVDARWEIKDM